MVQGSPLPTRQLFVAGSTGATGQVLVPMADRLGLRVVPHVRPKSVTPSTDPRAAVVDLADAERLVERMRGCTTVLQLIGTMRRRFSTGDTYETSDIGTTRQLLEAAKRCGVDHFVLLGSVGAGNPIGSYLKAKAKAEQLVKESGLPYTIFRPSALEGGIRKPIPLAKSLTRALGLRRYEPISLQALSAALLHCARTRQPLQVELEGESLWALVAEAEAFAGSLA